MTEGLRFFGLGKWGCKCRALLSGDTSRHGSRAFTSRTPPPPPPPPPRDTLSRVCFSRLGFRVLASTFRSGP